MEKNNISISGSGSIAGGADYGKISVSGSARIGGSILCESLICSGSVHADGNVECADHCRISGSFHGHGDFCAQNIHVSGSAHIGGAAEGKEIVVSGMLDVNGNVSAETLHVSGRLCCSSVEAEMVQMSAAVTVRGLLNAEQVTICPVGRSSVGSIGGSCITVRRPDPATLFSGIFENVFGFVHGRQNVSLQTDIIEGDVMDLAVTQANIVRGRTVTIRKDSRIRRVEYSESLTVEDGAVVEESVKTE